MLEDFSVNGALAVAFWASTLLNPNYPLLDGFSERVEARQGTVSMSVLEFQREVVGTEIGYSQTAHIAYGPIQPIWMTTITDDGGLWAGLGAYNNIKFTDDIFSAFYFIPGIYVGLEEVNLGGWLMFRSGIEVGMQIDERWSISMAYDHRSSGDLWEYNPGLETWQIRINRNLDR